MTQGGGRVEIRTNIVEKGEAGRGPRDGRGDSPWNTNGFRDNGHWPGVVHPHSPSNEDSTRSRLEVSFPPQVSPFHINPIRAEGRSTPASTTSLDKFIHNLFGDFVNRDFATGNLFLIAVCRNMLPIFRPWEIFKGCGWNGLTRFDDLSHHSLEIESNFVWNGCVDVWIGLKRGFGFSFDRRVISVDVYIVLLNNKSWNYFYVIIYVLTAKDWPQVLF